MSNILITGATGNVGLAVLEALLAEGDNHTIIAAHHNPDSARAMLKDYHGLSFRRLDFTDPSGFSEAFHEIDVVFLLRPPQLADVKTTFEPFVLAMKSTGIHKIVFLSVQGVEHQSLIPHFKLEKLIKDHELDYVFLRPSYFMQNLTTTLLSEIKKESRIYIPAGKLKFVWVDVRDIGKVAAKVLADFDRFRNTAIEITGSEILDFNEVSIILTDVLSRKVSYLSPNLVRFFIHKKRQGMVTPMILVMIMLHYLPRFGKRRHGLSSAVADITGHQPGLLKDFLILEKAKFSRQG